MSVNWMKDAEPGDIYADANGKLWRILSVYREPTIEAEEVEGTLNDPNAPKLMPMGAGIGNVGFQNIQRLATIDKRIQKAFTSAAVWFGWQRIWRNDWKSKQPPMPAATE